MNANDILYKEWNDPLKVVTAILDEIERRSGEKVENEGEEPFHALDRSIVEIRKELEADTRYPEGYWKNNAWTPS